MRSPVGATLFVTLIAMAACREGGRSPEVVPDSIVVREGAEVLISTSDALIGGIWDLVVDKAGVVYAVDGRTSQIHVVEGPAQVHSLGRPGAGPAEFSRPRTLHKRGDTLLVVDWGNGRLQGLSPSGTMLFTRPLPPGYAPSLGADGRLVRPTMGMDSALAVIHAPDLSVIAPIGQIVGSRRNMVDMRGMKEEIQQGKVPDLFLNTAEAVVTDGGATWLYVPARGSIQRFDALGREMFSVTLNEPEHELLFDRFVSENATKPANAVSPLRYIADATPVGEDLWVLLGSSTAGPAALRIIHADGRIGDRIECPDVTGATQLAVDQERGFGYFVKRDVAELVRVNLRGADTQHIR